MGKDEMGGYYNKYLYGTTNAHTAKNSTGIWTIGIIKV